jgi:RNA polymerase sigma-70 factor, ECF subfamily
MELAIVTAAQPEADPAPEQTSSALAPLLAAAARGDGGAWRALVDAYGRRIYALAKSRCQDGHVAEEIAQSVFATVAAKLGGGEYEEQGKFEAWLFRVAMNRVRDHIRRQKRHGPDGGDAALGTLAAGEASESGPDVEEVGRLRWAMGQLSESDREIVELRHQGGMSFKQMAEVLEEPMGTLLARHHRALKKLRDLMERRAIQESSRARAERVGMGETDRSEVES